MLEQNVKDYLTTALNHEINLTQKLYELLVNEQACYEKQELASLEGLLKDKASTLDQIEKSATQRLNIFGIKPLMKNHSQLFEQQIGQENGLKIIWNNLKELMFKCKTQNEINGRIITLSQKSLERTINIFKQSLRPNNLTTYTAKGKAQQTPINISAAKA